ncbi:hypothetical protein [Euzebya sp.]|uniref:hypothetical protein n=1 Tax=Euzebya sp. TaxID=1971409 RepID=UPI0035184FD0
MSPAATAGVVTHHVPREEFDEELREAISSVSDLTLDEFIERGRSGDLEEPLDDLWLMVAPLFR